MLLVLLALGCGSSPDDHEPTPPAVELRAPPAWDPLGVPLQLTVLSAPAQQVSLEILDPSGALLEALPGATDADGRYVVTWSGGALSTGLHRIRAAAPGGPVVEQALALVRPGFVTAWASDDRGDTSLREPLYWGADKRLQALSRPVSELPSLEDAAALPRDFPPLTADLYFEPVDGPHPVAYTWDSLPLLILQPGATSALGDPGLHLVDVAVEVDGFEVVSGLPLSADAPVVLRATAPLLDGPGVFEEALVLRFTSTDGSGEVWPLAEQRLPMRVYLLLGPSGFSRDGDRYKPWTGVVDPALRAITGVAPEHGAVVDALVDFVYHDLNLRYDTFAGASHYSEYPWGDWSRPRFYLTDFLRRKNGNTINCSDAGNILATYANMVGAPLDHIVILNNFQLNEIKAIGHGDYTSCPFGPFGCGFSYHAVTTTDAGQTVWDATLLLDGDANPGAAPHVELLVQSLSGQEYLTRLVRSGSPSYQHQAEVTIE